MLQSSMIPDVEEKAGKSEIIVISVAPSYFLAHCLRSQWAQGRTGVNTASQDKPTLIADLARKYVCIKDVAADGSVRFDFAIGFPDLSVELVMPKAAFDEFCRRNDVELIGPGANPPLTGEGD